MTENINLEFAGVTIGIPLFNEEKYIEAAIRSAALQCEAVWVSDNASTDGSAAICEAMSHEYPNVYFIQQQKNLGAISNFKLVLKKAKTPYFMWLGGHDMLPQGYVQNLKKLLENNQEAVMAYGASQHINVHGEFVSHYDYFYSSLLADESPSIRTLGLIRYLSDCSLIHGVFRTNILHTALNSSGSSIYRGADHVLLGHAALKGRFVYCPETYLIRRDVHPVDTPKDQLKRMAEQAPNEEQLTYRIMQRQQYAFAVSIYNNAGWAGLVFRIRTRYYLVNRFGSFGETFITHCLDWLLRKPWIRKFMN